MSKTLSSELIRCQLVKQKEKASSERGNCPQEESLDWFPKNRLGRPVIWAKWVLRKRLPDNVTRRCSLCGSRFSQKSNQLVYSQEITEKVNEYLKVSKLFICLTCRKE